jgi:hypothetical protein
VHKLLVGTTLDEPAEEVFHVPFPTSRVSAIVKPSTD